MATPDAEPVTSPGALHPEIAALLREVEKNATAAQVRQNTEVLEDLRESLAPLVTLVGCVGEIVHTEIGHERLGKVRIGTLLGLVFVIGLLLGVLAWFDVDAKTANEALLGWCEGLGVCDPRACIDVVPSGPTLPVLE
jgi:hypothetical protein